MLDTKALAAAVAIVVRDAVQASVPALIEAAQAPLLERLATLEGRQPEPGRPGKDADPEVIRALVEQAVAVIDIPQPRDGEDGTSVDPDEVRQMVADAVAALPPAAPGRDADPAVIRQMVTDAVAVLPPAAPGRDADPAVIRQMITDAVAALPPAASGRDADPAMIRQMVVDAVGAIDIPEPQPGRDADMDQVRRWIEEQVAALPAPADGKSVTVEDVAPIVREAVATAVAALPAAKDGVGLAGALIDRKGMLILTLSDGKMCELGRVDGTDGEPGLGFDDMLIEQTGERTVTLRFTRGDQAKTFDLTMPTVIDRGVYKAGQSYEAGDAVTFGGSLWIAQKSTDVKPDGPDTGWRLAVKKGRDGRDLTKE